MLRKNALKRLEGRRAVIHTRDDQSIRGLIARVAADSIWFEAGTAEYLPKEGEVPDELEGVAWVLRDNVSFGQEL